MNFTRVASITKTSRNLASNTCGALLKILLVWRALRMFYASSFICKAQLFPFSCRLISLSTPPKKSLDHLSPNLAWVDFCCRGFRQRGGLRGWWPSPKSRLEETRTTGLMTWNMDLRWIFCSNTRWLCNVDISKFKLQNMGLRCWSSDERFSNDKRTS